MKRSYTEAEQRRNTNVSSLFLLSPGDNSLQSLARDLLHQALHIRYSYEAFARDGVTAERLEEFKRNHKERGPKLRNTRLDKTGLSTKTLMDSSWNRTLISILSKKAKSIASQAEKRFEEKIDWIKLFDKRVYRIMLDEVKSRPLDDETHQERLLRLAKVHSQTSKRSGMINVRHMVCAHTLA